MDMTSSSFLIVTLSVWAVVSLLALSGAPHTPKSERLTPSPRLGLRSGRRHVPALALRAFAPTRAPRASCRVASSDAEHQVTVSVSSDHSARADGAQREPLR